ncbi:MAG: FeoB small GTPase domain-containing protein, partial [Flavobacteriaceae bacterium]
MAHFLKVALIGNPNTGKTSVFNALTGLNQKVGNYPGITVEKKEGSCRLNRTTKAHILDLPGTYSLNASSMDESVVIELLLNRNNKDFPDVAVVVTDVENLKRNLLLFTQIKDLEIPTLLVVNMSDQMKRKGISIDLEQLQADLGTQVILTSMRHQDGVVALKEALVNYRQLPTTPLLDLQTIDVDYFSRLQKTFPSESLYKLWLVITQDVNFSSLERNRIQASSDFKIQSDAVLKRLQQKETIKRYQIINQTLKQAYQVDSNVATDLRSRIDRIL